jgi:hypothetical protein
MGMADKLPPGLPFSALKNTRTSWHTCGLGRKCCSEACELYRLAWQLLPFVGNYLEKKDKLSPQNGERFPL